MKEFTYEVATNTVVDLDLHVDHTTAVQLLVDLDLHVDLHVQAIAQGYGRFLGLK